jgi:hypothetical protein
VKRLALLGLVVLVAGCGGAHKRAAPTTLMTSEPSPTTTTTAAAPGPTTSLAVFFVRDGRIAPVRREVPETKAIGAAALAQLLAGPTDEERSGGLASAIPSGTQLGGLTITGGDAHVDGLDGLDREALGQVVYTLTQFPTVKSVDGHTRASMEDVTPIILVDSPLPGDTVTSPVRVRGTANVFEATLEVHVVGASGDLGVAHVTATEGAPQRGSFDATIQLQAHDPGPAKIVAFDVSQADGTRQHVFTVPVVLR